MYSASIVQIQAAEYTHPSITVLDTGVYIAGEEKLGGSKSEAETVAVPIHFL